MAALTDDDAFVELIADGHHVHPALWGLIRRAKPVDRLILVSDALSLSGTGPGRTMVGATEVEVLEDRAVVAGTTTLAGSVMALDSMLRNLVRDGASLPAAARAASTNPAALLDVTDRGRLAPGLRADLVEMGGDLMVRRVGGLDQRDGPGHDGGISAPHAVDVLLDGERSGHRRHTSGPLPRPRGPLP